MTTEKTVTNKEKNEAFKKMTAPEKRVAIARDVLAGMKADILIAKSGTYLDDVKFREKVRWDMPLKVEDQAKPLMDAVESCNVCGIGSMFVSTVMRFNKLTIGDIVGADTNPADDDENQISAKEFVDEASGGGVMYEYLEQFFPAEDLRKVEEAFEGGSFCAVEDHPYPSDDIRLRLIMENIVANEGRFRPSKKPVITNVGGRVTFTTPGFTA